MFTIKTDKPYKIYADVLEEEALKQFESAMQMDFVVKGALMPDAHTGYALPIGAVVATQDVIVPSWIGYDIGCGMCAVCIDTPKNVVTENAKEIFDQIYRDIPVGFSHNKEPAHYHYFENISDFAKKELVDTQATENQLGTLGGGNHFIEIGSDEQDRVWIVVHSGSRNVGHKIATHYMKRASGDGKAREGHFGLPVDSETGQNYLQDMAFGLDFALANRKEIILRSVKAISHALKAPVHLDGDYFINRNHNHAEFKDGLWIHRKGATHAEKDMLGVIPGNMRDGSFIVEGIGNPNSLCSSSHGAGRVLGRKEAKKTLDLSEFSSTMSNVIAKVDKDTLDESPFAYKNIFDVMKQQSELVQVKHHIKPIINIKG